MSTQIQIRRDTTANWSSVDPVLAEGEIGYDLTEGQFKVGDGTTVWSGLDYSGGSSSGGTGSSVHIGEAPPDDPQEGQQWMEVPADGDATMWIYDGDKWLQQPGGGGSADVDLSNYYTKSEANAAFKPSTYTAPVDSVNGETGAVNLTAADIGASTFMGEVLTQAEYDAITPDPNTVYFIK